MDRLPQNLGEDFIQTAACLAGFSLSEGRILRQGNANAVVRIHRYVTEGSFDAYMWQTLETKAKFIAQVMTGQSTARRIEDLDTPALTYAEVKAIASGNPLVIEKASVDSEVMRLSRLRAEHLESQFTTRRRQRMLDEDGARLESRLAALNQDLAARCDTQGDRFSIILNGETFHDRPKAGGGLIYAIEDHRKDHLLGRPATTILGEFAGFRIEFRSTRPDHLTLRGAGEYVANVSASPVGIISSLEHAARSVEDHIARCETDLAQTSKNATELSALAGRVFDHEERYRELVARQAALVDKLDITKNQAPEQLAADAETDGGEGEAAAPEVSTALITEPPAPAAKPQASRISHSRMAGNLPPLPRKSAPVRVTP